ncbi:MOB kinase activator-like 1A isoform X1 [Nymphaea colorata]|nr:MOB kinase activator-like 1A isoform X1 [Nymphaea colorata]
MSLFGLGSRNQKTFRPKKNTPSGSKGAQLQRHIDATLGSGNLREAVRLPPGEDPNEWLAVNTVDFFNQVNVLYGTLTEFCTPNSCPTMTAGPKYEYRWADGVQIKKPIEVSAPKYVDYLMDWIEAQLDNESIFPQKLGAPFPPNFRDVVKTIFKRLFRVYAHIYHSHFQKIVDLPSAGQGVIILSLLPLPPCCKRNSILFPPPNQLQNTLTMTSIVLDTRAILRSDHHIILQLPTACFKLVVDHDHRIMLLPVCVFSFFAV